MEENRIVALISALAAGAVATAAVAMNWRKINRAVGKAKKGSLTHLKQLKATINHIRPQKPASALRKKSRGQTEELVANRISGGNDGSGKGGNGNGYRQKILDLLNQGQKGWTLQELSANLDVSHIALVGPVKRLVNDGNLRKEGNLYLINQAKPDRNSEDSDMENKISNQVNIQKAVVQEAQAIAQGSAAAEPSVPAQQPGEVSPQ